jgi:FMN-dependent NADH-azoreductase
MLQQSLARHVAPSITAAFIGCGFLCAAPSMGFCCIRLPALSSKCRSALFQQIPFSPSLEERKHPMPSLLAITSSPRGDDSISNTLTHTFVDAWKSAHSGDVVTRDLMKTDLPFVGVPWIIGAYTPAETHSPEVKQAISISDNLIAEFKQADHIVLGVPMYNFSIPAVVKAYIDHLVRVNVTFSSSYEGLVKGKTMTIIIASGGVYSAGSHMEGYNVETAYLKQIFGFIGITDVTVVLAGGSNDVNQGKATKDELVAKYAAEVKAAASR